MAQEPDKANPKPPPVDLLSRVSDLLLLGSRFVERFHPTKITAIIMGVWTFLVISATAALLSTQPSGTRQDISLVVMFIFVIVPVLLVLQIRPFTLAALKAQGVLGLFWLLGILIVPLLVGSAGLLFRLVVLIVS